MRKVYIPGVYTSVTKQIKKVYTKRIHTGTKNGSKNNAWRLSHNLIKIAMTPKEFFYLVAEMREAQKAYFETRSQKVFRACRALENNVDKEIRRVREIVNEKGPNQSD